MKYFREACCAGADAVAVACRHGADRIELCAQLEIGGVTPDRETIREALRICAGTEAEAGLHGADRNRLCAQLEIGGVTPDREAIREALRICAGTEAEAGLHGADRTGLCAQLEIGGVTPDRETIREALRICAGTSETAGTLKSVESTCSLEAQGRADTPETYGTLDTNDGTDLPKTAERTATPLNVLVRPRGGDFVYTEEEIQTMLADIRSCKKLGANGVVIGALTPDGHIDLTAMRRLISEARPLQVTFHRAFDECASPVECLEEVIGLGCERLLSSGHEADAYAGRFTLAAMVRQAAGRITIMAGCGVRPSNIAEIAADSQAPEFHSSTLDGW